MSELTQNEIQNITSDISDIMRNLFIETYRLYELEKLFNYENYNKYPYKDRKTSIQIFADFDVSSYSVNGLFVEEDTYEKVYPPLIITRIENVLTQINIYRVVRQQLDGSVEEFENVSEIYQLREVKELVEIENTTVQTIRYLFPFTAAQSGNSTVINF